MKIIITGMNGTVAPVLAQAWTAAGATVVPWDRAIHPTEPEQAVRFFIESERPDGFCHLAMGSPDWAATAAHTCADLGIPFLFTSTVSVYAAAQVGPFTVDDAPQPDDDYGRYKLDCENRILAAYPNAHIARIGWQIGTAPGGNQMIDYLDRQFREQGVIEASSRWFPGCSFLADTADALIRTLDLPPGRYHLDGNPGLHFYDIAAGLNRLLGTPWKVVPVEGHTQNHRMLDPRIPVRPLTERIGTD
jgi:dTDP-4-dehydrorhamnose reductase